MEVVKFERPTVSDEIARVLEAFAERARAGEFENLVIVALCPDGRWLTRGVGEPDTLRMIGVLESAKADVLSSSETDQKSGA